MVDYKKELKKVLKSIDEKYFQRNERDFSYELYHKLRGLNLDVDVTAETPKRPYRIPELLLNNSFFKNHFFKTENYDLEKNDYNRIPDLLFHQYENKNKQLIACEIKPLSTSNELICRDLSKLLYYTKSNLRYKYGVLILFSTNENDLKINRLKNLYEKALKNFFEIEIWIVYPKRVHVIRAAEKETKLND
jgi:hypothetical protein